MGSEWSKRLYNNHFRGRQEIGLVGHPISLSFSPAHDWWHDHEHGAEHRPPCNYPYCGQNCSHLWPCNVAPPKCLFIYRLDTLYSKLWSLIMMYPRSPSIRGMKNLSSVVLQTPGSEFTTMKLETNWVLLDQTWSIFQTLANVKNWSKDIMDLSIVFRMLQMDICLQQAARYLILNNYWFHRTALLDCTRTLTIIMYYSSWCYSNK